MQDGQPVFANRSLCDALGLTMQEAMTLTAEQGLVHLHPDDFEKIGNARNSLLHLGGEGAASTQLELRWIRADDELRWLDVQISAIDYRGRLAFLMIVLDITERKRAELKLLESEKINRLLLETTRESIILIDLDGTVLTCNETTARRLGRSINQVVGQCIHDLVSPEVAEFRKQKLVEVFSSRKAIIFEDQRDEFWFLNNFYPIFDEQQNIIQFAIFSVDITERKLAELNLMESEKLNRLLLETTQNVVVLFDKEARILTCNSNAARAMGHEVEYLKGRSQYDLQSPAITRSRLEKFEEVILTGKTVSFEDQRAGRWFLNTFCPVLDNAGQVLQVALFATDITERVAMEDELRQQKENLEAEVAARTRELRVLSHELIRAQEAERLRVSRELHDEAGQLLVELGMSLDAVFDELPKEQRLVRKRLKVVSDLVSRATRSIRLLARSLRPPALEVAGLNTVLQDLCREYSNFSHLPISYYGQEINLPDVISISLYRFVQEALTNVVKHARASESKVRMEVVDGHISLTVSDNGKGMDQEKHAGLGLLGIQERASLLGGQVDIQSSVNGTSLKLSVPVDGRDKPDD